MIRAGKLVENEQEIIASIDRRLEEKYLLEGDHNFKLSNIKVC